MVSNTVDPCFLHAGDEKPLLELFVAICFRLNLSYLLPWDSMISPQHGSKERSAGQFFTDFRVLWKHLPVPTYLYKESTIAVIFSPTCSDLPFAKIKKMQNINHNQLDQNIDFLLYAMYSAVSGDFW